MIYFSFINQFFIFLIICVGLWVAFWVLLSGVKIRLNQMFFLMTTLILLWVVFAYLSSLPNQISHALLWRRLAFGSSSLFFVPAYYLFVVYFSREGKKAIVLDKVIILIGIFFSLISIFTGLIVKDVKIMSWGTDIIFGRGMVYLYLAITPLTFIIIFYLIKKYHEVSKPEKLKIQYFLVGVFLFALFNLIFNVIIPIVRKSIQYYQFGDYSTIFLLSFTSYAIVKQKLFNIKSVLTAFFVGLPAILLGVDTFVFTPTTALIILKSIVLLIFLWLGYSLIQNVEKETKRCEVLERLMAQLKAKTKELKIKNIDLKETLEARTNFLTVASHQLRTPVSVIKGSLQMIVDGTLTGEKKEDFIQRSLVQANRLADTIHDILSSTAIEGKGFKLNKRPADIDELISKIIKDREVKLERKNKERGESVKLIYHKPKSKMPLINIDSNKIEEAIANLIDNAIQYTSKGEIEITAETDEERFVFTIKDTGIGIDKKDMPKLFTKISRLDNAISIRPDGTGLGLFIVKGMVEKHGGKADVRSDGSGKGSIFTFWIPNSAETIGQVL